MPALWYECHCSHRSLMPALWYECHCSHRSLMPALWYECHCSHRSLMPALWEQGGQQCIPGGSAEAEWGRYALLPRTGERQCCGSGFSRIRGLFDQVGSGSGIIVPDPDLTFLARTSEFFKFFFKMVPFVFDYKHICLENKCLENEKSCRSPFVFT
jgi:hypothetical protein